MFLTGMFCVRLATVLLNFFGFELAADEAHLLGALFSVDGDDCATILSKERERNPLLLLLSCHQHFLFKTVRIGQEHKQNWLGEMQRRIYQTNWNRLRLEIKRGIDDGAF